MNESRSFGQTVNESEKQQLSSEIAQTIRVYFDFLQTCHMPFFDQLFDPGGFLCTLEADQAAYMTIPAYREIMRQRTPPQLEGYPREESLQSVDFASNKQVAVKVIVRVADKVYADHLIMFRLSEGWRIVSKVYSRLS